MSRNPCRHQTCHKINIDEMQDSAERKKGSQEESAQRNKLGGGSRRASVWNFALLSYSNNDLLLSCTESVSRAGLPQRIVNVLYLFFTFASALSKFFFTLNLTILLIKANGIGLSKGNLTVPFAPS